MSPQEALDLLHDLFIDPYGEFRTPPHSQGGKFLSDRELEARALIDLLREQVGPKAHVEPHSPLAAIQTLMDTMDLLFTSKWGEHSRKEETYFCKVIEKNIDDLKAFFQGSVSIDDLDKLIAVNPPWNLASQDKEMILSINPGTATPEEIAEILADLSRIYRKVGGSGITFRFEDATVNQEELA